MSAPPLPPSALPPLPPRKRGVAWILVLLVLLAIGVPAIIPGIYLEERTRGQMAWRSYATDAKARGVKLDMADFIPPKIPDAQNFASIPIFEAAFRAAEHGQDAPNPFKLPKPHQGELPKFSNSLKQAPVDLAAWQKYFVDTKLLPAAGGTAATDVLKALDHFATPLAELHDAATRPHCRFPVHWEQGLTAPLPHLGLIQDAAKLDALRATAHLAAGDSAAAYDDFHAGLRLSTAIRAEPSLISGLVRVAVISTMENTVWDGLASRRWAAPELQKIEADLAALDCLGDYVFTMNSERAASNFIIDMMIKKPRLILDAMGMEKDDKDEGSKSTRRFMDIYYPIGWHYQSKVRTNVYYDEMLARIEPAQRRWHGERAVPSSPENIRDLWTKFHYTFFMLLVPFLEAMERKYLQVAALTDHTRIACASERYRLAHGEFPQSLSELASEFIPRVPAEIVNGDPYHYRCTEDGNFVLYSVGINLRDDGGIIDPKGNATKQADWVWRYPAR